MTNNENKHEAKTQWFLIWKQFKKHKLAKISLIILAFFYLMGVVLPGFFAPYGKFQEFDNRYLPPQRPQFIDHEGNFHLRPFVYGVTQELDPATWQQITVIDESQKKSIYFFVRGTDYSLLRFFESDIHLFGAEGGQVFLFGTDQLGRDLFSRTIYASNVSLVIGLAGVFISLVLGLLIGGISGLMGGFVDEIIQRLIEIILSIPKIPLWMALAAAVPRAWSPVQVYFAITIIISLLAWPQVGRVVRSKFLSLKEEDFISAARAYNTPTFIIIIRHLIPNFISYILVSVTLAIPQMIIAETSLSFLGIGLQPPVVSLGVLLERAQSYQNVSMFPWILIPGLFVVIVVLSYNFVGDGLRDAADPYH